ncbi:MAG: enoyl-CoA hydratase/isomerase family protein [Proteobacteria bacterium]|nr:enoyl-CoA hydratase/isomerase family protein [Pseudomonadota bacterium]
MGTYKTITYDISGPVCRITLNRPDKFNAIDRTMSKEIRDAFVAVRGEDSVGVVVFSGNGKSFCSGGDLSVFPSLAVHQKSMDWLAHDGLDIQKAITNCGKVVIAKITGVCLAGGFELALACDLIYAKESSRFGFTEINMGILPGWGGTARIARSMPLFRAREIVYSGRKDYNAKNMYDMGMLTRVFADDVFEEEFEKVVANIASKKPIALRMAKEIMAASVNGIDIDAALTVERNAIQWLVYAPDIQAMMEGFRQTPDALIAQQKKDNERSDMK